ncbi:hypothetical protein JCM8547_007707 [Rhodosporidiobolus lusitaniae]
MPASPSRSPPPPHPDSDSAPPPRLYTFSLEERIQQLEGALEGPLNDATSGTKEELRRLIRYQASPATVDYPKKTLAAVLVLLHLNPLGELSVTLTTRSLRLRSHPGETALPGGRWEEGDGEEGEWTALREANEEIGLPLPSTSTSDRPHLLHLTTLPAFTSRTLLVVLPVVYLLLHPAASASQDYLASVLEPNRDEVDAIFHLPLRSFLLLPAHPSSASSHPSPERPRTRSITASSASPSTIRPPPGSETLTHSYQDFTWLLSLPYRLHSFSHPYPGVTPSAVTGLTADICIEVALLAAYGPALATPEGEGGKERRRLGFERYAEGQMKWGAIVEEALRMQGQKGLERGEEVRAVKPAADDQRTIIR